MAGKDLGTKHSCFKCGTKFYDFKKPEPICPKCGADQRQNPVTKAPPERRQKAAPKPAPEEVETDLDEEAEEAEVDVEDEEEAEGDDEG